MQFAIPYLATLLVFVGIDLIWLGFIAKGFYRAEIGALLADPVNVKAAAAFYMIYAAGLVGFAVQPAVALGGLPRGLTLGALFGFVAYATYDLTNLATLKGWSLRLSIVDMLWGAALSGAAATAGVGAAIMLANRS